MQRLFFLLLLAPLAFVMPETVHPERAGILAVIQHYAESADTRNSDLARQALHESSQQYLLFNGTFMQIGQAQYGQMLDAGQIGGIPRKLTVHRIEVEGNDTAMAKVTLMHDKMTLNQHIGLLKLDGRWQIVSILTAVV